MKVRPTNYFRSGEDLKILTTNCTYINLRNADIAITKKGNLFIKFTKSKLSHRESVEKIILYLINEGWNIKKMCNVFLY